MLLVGADPGHQVVLPDTSAVARILVQLRHGVSASHPERAGAVVASLDGAGLLVDGEEQDLLAAARAATRVRVQAPEVWREAATRLVETAGLGLAVRADGSDGDLTWLVTNGPPAWTDHDELLTRDDPALFTTVLPSRVRVGPFLVPGTTACLRCLRAQTPGVRPPQREASEPPGLPDDLPALVLHRALLLAVADLCAWAEGRQPVTWSAAVWVGDQFSALRQTWRLHPHCGCSWSHSMTG